MTQTIIGSGGGNRSSPGQGVKKSYTDNIRLVSRDPQEGK